MSKQKALNFKVQSFFDPLPPIAITFITAISKILAKFSFGISVFFKLLKNYILLNIKSKVARNTDLVPSEITLSTNPSTWTNGNVTVTASTTISGYTLQTSTTGTDDSWGTTNPLTFTSNGTAYARLWDGYNGGSAASKAITNIDKSAPTITSAEVKNLSSTGYDVYVYGVTDNQSGVNRVAFPTWTDYNGQDEIQSNWWASGSSAVGENQGNGTWHYRVNTSSHNYEAGAYNTHVYVYDNQGNSACVWTTAITVPTGWDKYTLFKNGQWNPNFQMMSNYATPENSFRLNTTSSRSGSSDWGISNGKLEIHLMARGWSNNKGKDQTGQTAFSIKVTASGLRSVNVEYTYDQKSKYAPSFRNSGSGTSYWEARLQGSLRGRSTQTEDVYIHVSKITLSY